MNLLSFIVASILWGGSFIAIKHSIGELSTLNAVFLRLLIATVFFRLYFLFIGHKLKVEFKVLLRIFIAGFFAMAFPWFLLFWAEKHISPALAGIINGTVPLWVLLLSLFLNNNPENKSPSKLLGLAIGFAGIATIFAPRVEFHNSTNEFLGIFAVVVMAISYAISGILTQKILKNYAVDTFTNVFYQILASLVVVGLAAAITENPGQIFQISRNTLYSLLYLGIGSSAIAYFLIYRLIPIWGIVRASTANYFVPFISILLQMIIHKETPTSTELIGVTLIFSGLLLANYEQLKSKQRL